MNFLQDILHVAFYKNEFHVHNMLFKVESHMLCVTHSSTQNWQIYVKSQLKKSYIDMSTVDYHCNKTCKHFDFYSPRLNTAP